MKKKSIYLLFGLMAVVLAGVSVSCKSSKTGVAKSHKHGTYKKVRLTEKQVKDAIESGNFTIKCHDAEGNEVPCNEVYDASDELPWLTPSQRSTIDENGDTIEIENLNQVIQYQMQKTVEKEQQEKK